MKTSKLNCKSTSTRLFFQNGATLLESLAFLGIAALVILGAIALLSGAFSGADSNRSMQDLSTIRTGIKKLFAGQSNGYTGLGNTTLINAKVFPNTLVVTDASSGTVKNQWGGTVTAAGNSTDFTITYNGVPKDVCVNIVTGNGEWSSVKVGSDTLATPVSPADANTKCSGATNNIAWTGN